MKNPICIILFLMLVVDASCQNAQDASYSFFVAGHVYGAHGESEKNIGVHPPFKEKLLLIKNDTSIAFGVLTGDMVYDGASEKEWDELDADIATMGKTVYFAPGNHDIGNSKKRMLFTKRYGASYQSMMHNDDLFIFLDTNLDPASITGDQLTWLKKEVWTKAKTSRNIFVFFHHVLWWQKDNRYKNSPLNSTKGRTVNNNFFTELYPMFEELTNEVFLFAGDTGAYDRGVMYDKTNNTTLIASGMGGRKEDNFVITHVTNNGAVSFQLISLNSTTVDGLGTLEDYKIKE
jgi:hypothetical protein